MHPAGKFISHVGVQQKRQASQSLPGLFFDHTPTQDHRPQGGNPWIVIKSRSSCGRATKKTGKPELTQAFLWSHPIQDHLPQGGNPIILPSHKHLLCTPSGHLKRCLFDYPLSLMVNFFYGEMEWINTSMYRQIIF